MTIAKLSLEEKERRKQQRRDDKWKQTHEVIDGIIHKICSICNNYIVMDKENFYENSKNGIDGFYPYCIPCSIGKSSKWGIDNHDRRLETIREWKKKDWDKETNRLKEAGRSRRESGKYQEWLKKNPEKVKLYGDNHRKHEVSNNEWEECKKYFNHRCAYCGMAIEDHWVKYRKVLKLYDFSREHVDTEGSNDLSNCIPSCRNCNSEKRTITLEMWFSETNENYTLEKMNKIIKWCNEDYLIHREKINNTIKDAFRRK